jgi:hypothetical protein
MGHVAAQGASVVPRVQCTCTAVQVFVKCSGYKVLRTKYYGSSRVPAKRTTSTTESEHGHTLYLKPETFDSPNLLKRLHEFLRRQDCETPILDGWSIIK